MTIIKIPHYIYAIFESDYEEAIADYIHGRFGNYRSVADCR